MIHMSEQVLFYITCGMFATWIVQMHSLKFKNMSRFCRVRESFICSMFTAAVSIPLLDFYPDLPPSICLMIGALMGTFGMEGWRVISNSIINIIGLRFGISNLNVEERRKDKDDEGK